MSNKNNPKSRFLRGIRQSIRSYEKAILSEKIRRGLEAKRRKNAQG